MADSCLVVCTPSRALLVALHWTMEVVAGGIMLGRALEGSLLLCYFDGGFWILFSHRGFLPVVNSKANLHKFVCAVALRGLLHSKCISLLTTVCCSTTGMLEVFCDRSGVVWGGLALPVKTPKSLFGFQREWAWYWYIWQRWKVLPLVLWILCLMFKITEWWYCSSFEFLGFS